MLVLRICCQQTALLCVTIVLQLCDFSNYFWLSISLIFAETCLNMSAFFKIVFREKRRKRSRDRDNKKDRPQDVSNSLSGDTFCVIVDVSY